MLAFGTDQGELTNGKHHPKYIWGSKDHDDIPRHFKLLCDEETTVPKPFFVSSLKVLGKSLELQKPVRFSEEWNRKSALYKGSCCRSAEAEGNPFKGKPGQSQKKSLTDSQPRPVLTPSFALSTETPVSVPEKEKTLPSLYNFNLFLIFLPKAYLCKKDMK